ncbi:MAG: arginine--tRNA ligase [Bacteriovoracaceae bacterium]
MTLKHDPVKANLSELIVQAVTDLYGEQDTAQFYSLIGDAPDFKMGHYAFPCFILAKKLKLPPPKLAESIAQKITEMNSSKIDKVINAGPYVNFFVKNTTYGELTLEKQLNGHYFKRQLSENAPRTMIEYSQPNTHKEIHVGHMRNLCLGDSLIRLHRYIGYDIVASTFPGDVGTHVAKCLWYLKNVNTEKAPETRKGAWLGKMYSAANNLLEDQRGTDKEESNRKALTEILAQLEKKSGEYYELWKVTREWSIELMKEVYQWAQVNFDVWYWESDVDADSLKLAKQYYEKGLFVQSEGAIGIDLSDYKLGFCLFIKSDGNGLYATKDIELARKKFTEFKIERSIYVVDKRQALHFQQVFKTLELMGFENARNCFHLQYDFVELPDGAMSSRKGNIVPLQELVDRMVSMIKTEYLAKYENDWSQEEINQTANDVARGAIKYGMVRLDNNKKIVFDMKEWLKLDGESGPYIQYSFARINSLCEKLGYEKIGYKEGTKSDWSVLKEPQEMALLHKLTGFNDVAIIAALQFKTGSMCSYLYDLSKLFNAFYAECSVGNAESADLKTARLNLCKAVSVTLEKGLNVLGITAPKRM